MPHQDGAFSPRIFLIRSGNGQGTVDGTREDVKAGDCDSACKGACLVYMVFRENLL